jgi:hypothetical protein
MANKENVNVSSNKSQPKPTSGPSGATDKPTEREMKFDEEGGDQPQAASQQDVDEELRKLDQAQRPDHPLDKPGNKRPQQHKH